MNVGDIIQILNIFLLIICVILFFIGVFGILKKDKKKSEKVISWIFTIVGLVFSAASATNMYQNNLYQVEIENIKFFYGNIFFSIKNLKQENWDIKEYTTNIDSFTQNIDIETNNNQKIDNRTINNTFIENSDMDPESLMLCAQAYYHAQSYEALVRIYSNPQLADNVVALTNLGYMYANGIYFEQDFKMAEDYYNKAIELGYNRAYTHKLAMYLKYNLDDIMTVFREGFELRNEIAEQYVAQFFCVEELPLHINYHYFCYMLEEQDQVDIIKNYMQYWELDKLIRSSSLPEETRTETYVVVSFESYIEPERGIAGCDYVMEKYVLRCNMIEFLNEEFILQ